MNPSLASRAESDQIFFGIVPRLAAKLLVVNLKIGDGATGLASPAVPSRAEQLGAKLVVQSAVQAQAWLLWSKAIHEAFTVADQETLFVLRPEGI